MPRSLQEATASLQQILDGSDGDDGTTVGKRRAQLSYWAIVLPNGTCSRLGVFVGCVGQLWKEAAVQKIKIGEVIIDAVIEREGPWRRPQDFFPAYDEATLQAVSSGDGAGGV